MQCPLCRESESLHLHLKERGVKSDQEEGMYSCTSMGHRHHNDIYYCKDCAHGFLHPFPGEKELENLYGSVVDETYREEMDGRIKTFGLALEGLPSIKEGEKLLEIGSYCGVFRHLAEEKGFKTLGIEPSRWAVERSQELFGLETINGLFGRGLLENPSFQMEEMDQVVAWDVLEHVHDPRDFLKCVHQLLRQGGTFSFSTIDIHSTYAKLMGGHWPWYMQMHLHYFTRKGLTQLLKEEGYKVEAYGRYRHVVSLSYLFYKVASLLGVNHFRPLRTLLGKIYLPISFGDVVQVRATKI